MPIRVAVIMKHASTFLTLLLLVSCGGAGEAELPETPKNDHVAPRIRVGNTLTTTKFRVRVVPKYPRDAKSEGVHGTVRMSASVSKTGHLRVLEVLKSPDGRLTKAAVQAVNQWQYEPMLLNGNPIEYVTVVDVNFSNR